MALIVEDGSAKSDAESYISVADADTYHTSYTGSADWSGASEAAREIALRKATLYLDLRCQGKWLGARYTEDQALAWPRMNVPDQDGFLYAVDEIPVALKRATAEAALRVIAGDDLLGVITEPGTVEGESVKVGPVTETINYVGGKPSSYVYPKIEALIQGLIDDCSTVSRG